MGPEELTAGDRVDLGQIEPGVYYLIERENPNHWTVLVCRNRPDGKTEILSVVCAAELVDARLQAFADIEEAPWNRA